jgi:hypothetical protein
MNITIHVSIILFNLAQSLIGSSPKKPRNIIENDINLS